MNKLVSKWKKHKIRNIQLFLQRNKTGFYEELDFVRRSEDSTGTQLKKYW